MLAEQLPGADQGDALGLGPPLSRSDLGGRRGIIGVAKQHIDPIEAAGDDLAPEQPLDGADAVGRLAQVQDLAGVTRLLVLGSLTPSAAQAESRLAAPTQSSACTPSAPDHSAAGATTRPGSHWRPGNRNQLSILLRMGEIARSMWDDDAPPGPAMVLSTSTAPSGWLGRRGPGRDGDARG